MDQKQAPPAPPPIDAKLVVLTNMEMIDAEREMIKRARDQCVAETKKFVECTKEKWFPSQSCKEEFKEYEKCLSQFCSAEHYRKVCDDMRANKLNQPILKKP